MTMDYDDPLEYDLMPDKDARMWATICHLSVLLGLTGIFFLNIIAPFVIWLLKKEDHPFIDEQGKECLNFQISIWIYMIVMAVLTLISALLTVILIGYVFLMVLIPAMVIGGLVAFFLPIYAAIQANSGVNYKYPFTLRLLS